MALRSVSRKEFRLVSKADPAIDRVDGLPELMRYVRSYEVVDGDDPVPRLLADVRPTWFVCRPLSASARNACEAKEADVVRWRWACQYGIIAVEGLDGEPWEPDFAEATPGQKLISERSMDRLTDLVGAGVIDEIGAAILLRASLNEAEKKDSWRPPFLRTRR